MRAMAASIRSRTALAALGIAMGTLGAATYRAVRLDPLPAPLLAASPEGGAFATRASPSRAAAGELDNDPFDPERRLPEEEASVDATAELLPLPVAPEAVRLLGTVVLPDGGGFAVYQLPSEVPKTVHIGETIGRLTLVGIEPGRAIFRAADGARVALELITGT